MYGLTYSTAYYFFMQGIMDPNHSGPPMSYQLLNPIYCTQKGKIVYNFGLSECNGVMFNILGNHHSVCSEL